MKPFRTTAISLALAILCLLSANCAGERPLDSIMEIILQERELTSKEVKQLVKLNEKAQDEFFSRDSSYIVDYSIMMAYAFEEGFYSYGDKKALSAEIALLEKAQPYAVEYNQRAALFSNLIEAYANAGQYVAGRELAMQAIDEILEVRGFTNPDMAAAYCTFAYVEECEGLADYALSSYCMSMDIYSKLLDYTSKALEDDKRSPEDVEIISSAQEDCRKAIKDIVGKFVSLTEEYEDEFVGIHVPKNWHVEEVEQDNVYSPVLRNLLDSLGLAHGGSVTFRSNDMTKGIKVVKSSFASLLIPEGTPEEWCTLSQLARASEENCIRIGEIIENLEVSNSPAAAVFFRYASQNDTIMRKQYAVVPSSDELFYIDLDVFDNDESSLMVCENIIKYFLSLKHR